MSVEAITVALNHSQAKGSTKLVLIGIANHHSDNGAWPSVRTLAGYANLSERRIQQALQELVDLGELTVEAQGGGGYQQYKTNRYWITLTCPPECGGFPGHKSGVKPASPRGEARFVSGVKPAAPEPLRETEENTRVNEFETFWKQYPRHEGKASAEKAYLKALKKISHSELVKALERYKAHNQKHSIIFAHAASWLNAERWADEYDVMVTEVREKAKAVSDEYLTFLREQEKLASPAPKCPHGENVALCRSCL
jgi:DNA-binding IscR family transcriptional regulator